MYIRKYVYIHTYIHTCIAHARTHKFTHTHTQFTNTRWSGASIAALSPSAICTHPTQAYDAGLSLSLARARERERERESRAVSFPLSLSLSSSGAGSYSRAQHHLCLCMRACLRACAACAPALPYRVVYKEQFSLLLKAQPDPLSAGPTSAHINPREVRAADTPIPISEKVLVMLVPLSLSRG